MITLLLKETGLTSKTLAAEVEKEEKVKGRRKTIKKNLIEEEGHQNDLVLGIR